MRAKLESGVSHLYAACLKKKSYTVVGVALKKSILLWSRNRSNPKITTTPQPWLKHLSAMEGRAKPDIFRSMLR